MTRFATKTKPDVTSTPASLEVAGMDVRYGGVHAVADLSLTLQRGESLGIIGSNGAGKTSTLKAIMGHVSRSAERLHYGETDLLRSPARQRVRLGIGYVPEGRHVFAGLSVEENLDLGAYSVRDRAATAARQAHVYDTFPVLKSMRDRLAGALSGGQQQMLAIGRALMSGPSLLLLDEPSMGLSPRLVGEIGEVLQQLRGDGLSMLVVEQNAKLTFAITDRCIVLENGHCVMAGESKDLEDDEEVRRIYLGL